MLHLGCWVGAGFWNQLPANCRARCKVPGASCKRNVSPKMGSLPGLVKVSKSWKLEGRVGCGGTKGWMMMMKVHQRAIAAGKQPEGYCLVLLPAWCQLEVP